VSDVTSTAWTPSSTGLRLPLMALLLILGCITTVAATIVGDGNITIALAPLALVVLVGATWVAPIRIPLLTITFLSLALDATGDGPWDSPLAPLGKLLFINLNKTIPIDALSVPSVVLVLLFLLVVHFHRHLSGSRVDTIAAVPAARVLIQALGISFLAVLGLCVWGLQSGGDMQMAKIQVQTFVLVLLVTYLCSHTLRGVRDFKVLGGLIIAAACLKSLYVFWVVSHVPPGPDAIDGKLLVAATHGDSLTFACAAVLLVVKFAEEPVRRNAVLCVILLPLLAAAMSVNNRRLVYVELAAALIVYALISRRSLVKRIAVHVVLASLPLLAAYVAIGWNSNAKIFAPVKVFRSVSDSDVDASTLYRDLENFNLLQTMKVNSLLGTGFGHPFAEVVTLPNISFFKEYRYMPHNSILGLWAFCGAFGFSGLMFAIVVGLYLAARSYSHARSADERIAAFMAFAMITIFLVHCWGDIGFSERKTMFLVGPALAIAGQLAVATSGWPGIRRKRLA
jgi:O-Antigen ligase